MRQTPPIRTPESFLISPSCCESRLKHISSKATSASDLRNSRRRVEAAPRYHSQKRVPRMTSTVTLRDISSQHLPAPVPYAVLAPSREEPLPLCIRSVEL